MMMIKTKDAETLTGLNRKQLSKIFNERMYNQVMCEKVDNRLYFDPESLLDFLSRHKKIKRHYHGEIDASPNKPFFMLTNYGYLYATTPDNGIYNLTTETRLTPGINFNGRQVVSIKMRGGQFKSMKVSQLIAESQLPNNLRKPIVHHIDGNPLNDLPCNLLPVTSKEHGELHRYLNRGMTEEYNNLVNKIKADNSQPVYEIPHPEYENKGIFEYGYILTQSGYDAYKTGKSIPASGIVLEFARVKAGKGGLL